MNGPLSQLHVRLFASVLLRSARELLGDDKLTDVNAVAQQVRDHFFGVSHSALGIPDKTHHQLGLSSDQINCSSGRLFSHRTCSNSSKRHAHAYAYVPVYEDSLQTGVDEVCHQRAIVSADSLDAFTVHLLMSVGTAREIEACVPLLVDQQVRVIHLWKGHMYSQQLLTGLNYAL